VEHHYIYDVSYCTEELTKEKKTADNHKYLYGSYKTCGKIGDFICKNCGKMEEFIQKLW